MADFEYTFIPVVPETKQPALARGFTYDLFQYGGDYRHGDYRQAGHVVTRKCRLVCIDIDIASDDAPEFPETALGKILDPVLGDIITYESATDVEKAHVYVIPPAGAAWPAQWATHEWSFDVKSNGFVRAEPAYQPTGTDPLTPDPGTWDELTAAVEADKTAHAEMFHGTAGTPTRALAGPWARDGYRITSDNQLTADIASMVAAGLPDEEIGDRLGVILAPVGDPWSDAQIEVKIKSARKKGFDAGAKLDQWWREKLSPADIARITKSQTGQPGLLDALRRMTEHE